MLSQCALLLTISYFTSCFRSSDACSAGFTGQSCDIPICTAIGSVFPPSGASSYGYLINLESLQNCGLPGFNTPFFVDSHSTIVTVDVLASGGSPKVWVHLNGNYSTSFQPSRVLQNTADRVVEQFDSLASANYDVSPSFIRAVACVVQISTQTNLTVSLGFAPNAAHTDDSHNFMPDNSASNVLIHVANLQSPGNASTVVIYQNGHFFDRLSLAARSNCAYEYYTPMTVKCERLHTYTLEVLGFDEQNNPWMRTAQVPCIGPIGR